MLKPRKELELELEFIKQDLYRNRQIESVANKLYDTLNGCFTQGKLVSIFNNNFPLIQLSEEELFHLSNGLYKLYPQLDVKEWFLDSEISEWINKEYTTKSKYEPIIELKDVSYNGNKLNPEFLCYISYKDLAELANSGKLEYDTNLQRSPKLITKFGKTVEIPTVNRDSVNKIAEKMSNGEFMANQITLNMLREDVQFFNYNNRKLTIDIKSGRCLIIDGFHRITALTRCMRQYPNTEGVLVLNIKNLDAEEVRSFIYQESLANRHDERTVGKFNLNNKITIFTNKLNNYMNSDNNIFYHRIKTPICPSGDLMNEDLFREALSISKLDTIINKDDTNLINFNYYFCNFFNNFRDSCASCTSEEDNIVAKYDLLNNVSFLTGLMCVAYKVYSSPTDTPIYDLILEKLNKSNIEDYLFPIPFTKSTRTKLYTKYTRLVEGIILCQE